MVGIFACVRSSVFWSCGNASNCVSIRRRRFCHATSATFGGFGEGTHEFIKEVTKDTDWSLNDPWVKPNPKSHAYLTFGFALARANARMLLHADSRRRSAKNRVRTTRPQSATS